MTGTRNYARPTLASVNHYQRLLAPDGIREPRQPRPRPLVAYEPTEFGAAPVGQPACAEDLPYWADPEVGAILRLYVDGCSPPEVCRQLHLDEVGDEDRVRALIREIHEETARINAGQRAANAPERGRRPTTTARQRERIAKMHAEGKSEREIAGSVRVSRDAVRWTIEREKRGGGLVCADDLFPGYLERGTRKKGGA